MPHELKPLFPPLEPDDDSTHGHRQLIGVLGMLLPVAVVLIDRWRPTAGLEPGKLLDSVSAYYYTAAVALFTGILLALAAFLLTYRGYKNDYTRRDRNAAIIACVAAVLVATFPTEAPTPALSPSWWTPTTGCVHGISAAVLFLDFAFFSLLLFPKSRTPGSPVASDKRWRNRVYIGCGVLIVVCIAWAGIAQRKGASILLPEALALEFFGISWLVKGRALFTAAGVARRTLHYTRNPGEFVASVRRNIWGE